MGSEAGVGGATVEKRATQGDPARRGVRIPQRRRGQVGKDWMGAQRGAVLGRGTANATAQRRAVFCVFK